MGTDCNMFLERRRKMESEWRPDPGHKFQEWGYDLCFGRFHQLFVLLQSDYGSGLYGTSYSLPNRGLPVDVSPEVRKEYTRDGSNNWLPNYMTLDEYIKILRIYFASVKIKADPDISPFSNNDWEDNTFVNVANYCLHQIDLSKSEAILLDEPGLEYEYRIIVYFDN